MDRLTQVVNPDGTITPYTVDANGNLIGDGARTYTYDGLNQLISVKQGADTLGTYSYNGDGLRIQKIAGSVTTRYYYDGNRIVNEGDGTAITASNIWGLAPIRRETGGQTGYYLYDGHPDVVAMVDPSGAVLATYGYDEFGQQVKASGTFDNPLRYTAEPFDSETGAIYLRSRYYRPDLGRFLTQDTWRGNPWEPWTLNRYAYVGNNPVNYVDPTGHWAIGISGNIGGSILFANGEAGIGLFYSHEEENPWYDRVAIVSHVAFGGSLADADFQKEVGRSDIVTGKASGFAGGVTGDVTFIGNLDDIHDLAGGDYASRRTGFHPHSCRRGRTRRICERLFEY